MATNIPTTKPPLTLQDLMPFGLSTQDGMLLFAGLILIAAMASVAFKLSPKGQMSKRVKALAERQQELKAEMLNPKRRHSKALQGQVHWMRRVVDRFKLLKSKQAAEHQQLLIEAGWRSKDATVLFAFANLVTPIMGLIAGIVLMNVLTFSAKAVMFKWATPLFMLYLGMKLPMIIVKRRRKRRYRAIQRALSDTLDLMTICAEAGLSLGAALSRVSKELGLAYPEMASELSLTALEMGFLPERNKALYNLSSRVNLEEIRGIVNVLVQTEKYGTPIAQAMRVLSYEFREQRMLRAENKAARLPAMMTVPMIMFILPTLFIVIITPAALRAMDSWK